jgi:hypothetical protein
MENQLVILWDMETPPPNKIVFESWVEAAIYIKNIKREDPEYNPIVIFAVRD